MNNSELSINENIDKIYSQLNIPFSELNTDIGKKMEIYGKNNPTCNSMLGIIQKIFKIVKDCNERGNVNKETKVNFFNMYNVLQLFNPLFFIILTLLIITGCEPIGNIQNSTVMQNIPTSVSYMYIFLFIIVMLVVVYQFIKQISKYSNVLQDIKTNKLKSFYVVILIISISSIIFINFILPTIVSPIVNSISSLSDDQKSNYKKYITYGIFIVLAILLVIFFSRFYKKKRLGGIFSGIDSTYFTMNGSITFYLMLIFSLLFLTALITQVFNGLGSFLLTIMLGFLYFIYIFIIYVILYTVLQGKDYNKLLLFLVILVIIATIACLYLLNQTVSSINTICDTTGDASNVTLTTILGNVFFPIILFFLSIYLYGNKYCSENWDKSKAKFYGVYTVYTIILLISWFSSNISVGTIYSIAWLVITIIQRTWVKKLLVAYWDDIKKFFSGVKHATHTMTTTLKKA